MLKVRICTAAGDILAEGTCSESGFFPPAVAAIYNAGRDLTPARSLLSCDTSSGSDDDPEGTRRATFGYSRAGHPGGGPILDDEVILHVERT